MDRLILAMVLAAIPIINWLFKYYFSSILGELNLFKKHVITFYSDLLFIPFNFLLGFCIRFNLKLVFLFFIVSLLLFFYMSSYWIKLHKKEKRPVYLFDIKKNKIKLAGYVELLFFTIEAVIILSFLFSPIRSIWSIFSGSLLIIFLLLCLPSSYKIHGKIERSDLIFVLAGLIILLIKLFYLIF